MIQFRISGHPNIYLIFQATQICISYFRPPTCRPAQEWRKNASANSSHPFHPHHPPIWWEWWYNYDDMKIWNHEHPTTIRMRPSAICWSNICVILISVESPSCLKYLKSSFNPEILSLEMSSEHSIMGHKLSGPCVYIWKSEQNLKKSWCVIQKVWNGQRMSIFRKCHKDKI